MRFRHHSSDLAQTLSFGVIHVALAISLGWLLAGTFVFGALLAVVEPVVNTAVSHRIGKLFKRLPGGKRMAILKSAAIGVAHLVVAVTLAKLLTGSFASAWIYALVEPAANAVAHYFFERWWERAPAARWPMARPGHAPAPSASAAAR